AFDAHGWTAVAVTILSLTAVAAVLAALFLRNDQAGRVSGS
ncbi:MAG: hypothetical protein K0R01_4136, partial [Mycobacterium sp.]|nr:hypothetical protein [Mycobacterium sp.]